MKVYDLIIIGGGAAGLMAAIKASEKGKSVLVLEKGPRCGRKIMITGKGRCNITNTVDWPDFSTHIHSDNNFFRPAFYNFSNKDLIEFFDKIGLPTIVERGNRVFPLSGRAVDVADKLIEYAGSAGVVFEYDFEADKVVKESNGEKGFFLIRSKKGKEYTSYKVVLATGGLSYPLTGSTGDGYSIAKSFGHTIITPRASLTALIPENYDHSLDGILLKNVELRLIVAGTVIQSEFGEVQFTNDGIEGALGFKLSRKAVRFTDAGEKVAVELDLKPAVSMEELTRRIMRESEGLNQGVDSKFLKSYMPVSLIGPFLRANAKTDISNLPSLLKGWRFKITDYVGFRRAVVTQGGVSLREVSRKTMESKLISGLYFAGEILDLDGDTGGYNLQIAFSTGALAGN